MNRIELYIDKNNRLTIDFFYNHTDDFPMSRFKGKECYSIISQICQSKLLEVNQYEYKDEIVLLYNECIMRVDDCSQTFEKIGTGPLKKSVYKFYEDQNKKNLKLKKVSRKNKYTKQKIIASTLVLAILGGIIVDQFFDRNARTPEQTNSSIVSIEQDNLTTGDTLKNESSKSIEYDDLTFTNEEQVKNINIYIDYEDRSSTEKAQRTKAYYGDIIEKYAKRYGLNPQIIIGIATQERGVHSTVKDPGGATGLMQLQNAVWAGEKITAYNYETKSYETLVVEEEKLSDIFYNIKVGCMYFQNCMDYMNNNLLAAIQCYNMGYGNMKKILKAYSLESGKSVAEILKDVSDCGWLNYRNIIKKGDANYLEHVLSWINTKVNINDITSNGVAVNLSITNKTETKNMSFN